MCKEENRKQNGKEIKGCVRWNGGGGGSGGEALGGDGEA